MTILVTGGAGYIGSQFVHDLLDSGRTDFVIIDDFSTGNRTSLPTRLKIYEGDINDRELIQTIVNENKIDQVVHFAAKIVVAESVANPLMYYNENTMKTKNLVSQCLSLGIKKFIFSSTAAVYGEAKAAPIPENAPKAPINPYGRSKLMSEWIMADLCAAYNAQYVILRYFNIAGADPNLRCGQMNPGATHLMKAALNAALGKSASLIVNGSDYDTPDGSCVRDYIHVKDLAAAHVKAIDHLNRSGESLVLNCGYGHGFSVFEVINTVQKVSQVKFEVEIGPRRLGDPAKVIADSTLIRQKIGWTPRFNDLNHIIQHALEWEKHLQMQ